MYASYQSNLTYSMCTLTQVCSTFWLLFSQHDIDSSSNLTNSEFARPFIQHCSCPIAVWLSTFCLTSCKNSNALFMFCLSMPSPRRIYFSSIRATINYFKNLRIPVRLFWFYDHFDLCMQHWIIICIVCFSNPIFFYVLPNQYCFVNTK